MNVALRALNRFGFGAAPGESSRLDDPVGWLEDQVDRGGPPLLDPPAAAASPGPLLAEQRDALRSGDPEARRALQRRIVAATAGEACAALEARLGSQRPFVERWVAFWSNHLCVSAARGLPTRLLAGAYEREAIRPRVLGRYEDLLLASMRHPAMLTYLDNARSVGPSSAAGRRASRRRQGDAAPPLGLNENHARELLELHTVGVDGGYGQDDVRELARILTGWTVTGLGPLAGRSDAGADVGFVFVPLLHEPGDKRVLGRRYAEDGVGEGEAVVRDLARYPSTATFLATKLVRHFVADDPPPAAVERVAGVFRDTGGDLREVARAVVGCDEAWAPDAAKFRTPQDWLLAMLRAVGAREVAPPLLRVLADLRQPLWAPPSPAGYPDTLAGWADPDALMNRAELARTVARTVAGRRRGGAAPRALAAVVERSADDPLEAVLADDSIPVDERVALAFAGPAFQWR